MRHCVCPKELPILRGGAKRVYQPPYHKPIKIGALVVQYHTDQLEKKGGRDQEVFGSQELRPLAFRYLSNTHLFSKGTLQCGILPVSMEVGSFLSF